MLDEHLAMSGPQAGGLCLPSVSLQPCIAWYCSSPESIFSPRWRWKLAGLGVTALWISSARPCVGRAGRGGTGRVSGVLDAPVLGPFRGGVATVMTLRGARFAGRPYAEGECEFGAFYTESDAVPGAAPDDLRHGGGSGP